MKILQESIYKLKEISRKRKLQEMSPQRIGNLRKKTINQYKSQIQKYINDFNKSSEDVMISEISTGIWELKVEIDGVLCYISDPNKPLTYFSWITRIPERKGLPSSAIYQSLVWKDRTSLASISAANVMLKILLPKYKCICSDKEQTEHGEKLWDYLVERALDMNLKVRLVNFSSGKFSEYQDIHQYLNDKNDEESGFYGSDSWFKQFRICIYTE